MTNRRDRLAAARLYLIMAGAIARFHNYQARASITARGLRPWSRLIGHILEKAGAEVTIAGNGQVGVNVALGARDDGDPFNIILMDIQMPVMNGYDATEKLRQAGYLGTIIALTAHAITVRPLCFSNKSF